MGIRLRPDFVVILASRQPLQRRRMRRIAQERGVADTGPGEVQKQTVGGGVVAGLADHLHEPTGTGRSQSDPGRAARCEHNAIHDTAG